MRQTKLDGQLDGEEKKDGKQQHYEITTNGRAQADQEVGSKRKADMRDDNQGTTATEKHEAKTARKDDGGDDGFAVDTAQFTTEQQEADKELRGADVEESKAAAQDQSSDGKISWQITEKGL